MDRKTMFVLIALMLVTAIAGSSLVFADNVTEFLNSAEQNYKAQKYSRALRDLEWARKEIAALQLEEMKGFLPDSIDGMKGEGDDSTAIMGMHSVSKIYRDMDTGNNVKIEIMKGSSGDGGSGLGAIFGMAAAMGAMDSGGQSKTIVQKGYRGTFTLNPDINEGKLMFNLEGGSMVSIETRGYPDETMAKKAAEKLDLVTIEEKLK
jgi:hypothetical protein